MARISPLGGDRLSPALAPTRYKSDGMLQARLNPCASAGSLDSTTPDDARQTSTSSRNGRLRSDERPQALGARSMSVWSRPSTSKPYRSVSFDKLSGPGDMQASTWSLNGLSSRGDLTPARRIRPMSAGSRPSDDAARPCKQLRPASAGSQRQSTSLTRAKAWTAPSPYSSLFSWSPAHCISCHGGPTAEPKVTKLPIEREILALCGSQQGEPVVVVEVCHSCDTHRMSTRHIEGSYKAAYDRVEQAVRLLGIPCLSLRMPLARLRCGACEVYLVTPGNPTRIRIVHSKLDSRKWPCSRRVQGDIRKLLGVEEPALPTAAA